jgi:shikimate dehydrogenase
MLLPTHHFHLGLTGYPVSHSLSPKIQNAALKACGLTGDYSLFPIHPDDAKGLEKLLGRVRCNELQGLNVTIPHKQNVIPFLDELTPTARAIGAVNTIYRKENKLIGDNTDAPGFLSDLKKLVATETRRHRDLNVLVLGAGGSARAIVYALLNDGWNVILFARRIQQAKQLAASFTNHQFQNTDNLSNIELSNISLIVNTTPLGMTPNTDQSPLPENTVLSKDTFIYDLVYNPRETKLVKDARAQGCSAATGLGMLIEQAALAFELWTGHKPPREVLYQAIT